jgi:hypothetical protein
MLALIEDNVFYASCAIRRQENMDEEPEYPNTKRFWRINEIEALKMMTQFKDSSFAETPEEYKSITWNKQRLEDLQAQESRLLSRYARRTGRILSREAQAAAGKNKHEQNSHDRQDFFAEELELPF